MAENPFKKISDDWKKGWQKMQDNFNKTFHISPNNPPQTETNDVNPSTPSNNTTPSPSSLSSSETFINAEGSQPINKNSDSAMQSNWQSFVSNTQSTFSKWQTDWETFIKQSQEKTKARNEKWKTEWEANNKRTQDFFKKQQEDFNQKVKTMNEEMKQKDLRRKENMDKSMQSITGTWNGIVENNRKEMNRLQKMQARLWWKGYFNTMLWIMLFVIMIGGVMWILRYFGILDFIQSVQQP